MARERIPYKVARPIVLAHPVDQLPPEPDVLLNDAAGASCEFRVYDPKASELLSIAELSGSNTFTPTNVDLFEVGDIVEVEETDDTIYAANVTDITAGVVTLDGAGLSVGAAVGARFRVRLGVVVAMAEYGVADFVGRDWGYVGVLEEDHAAMKLDLEIDVEIHFVGNPAGGLGYRKTFCFVVKNDTDCEC